MIKCDLCGILRGTLDRCTYCGGEHRTCARCYSVLATLDLAAEGPFKERLVSTLYVCPSKELRMACAIA